MDNETNISSPKDDGAGDKLFDEKNGHNSKGVEVKYATPTSHNGDAKIDIENIKAAFAGMGKEELMKFANDPFWVRMRWSLFILFWLLWIGMLVGAIAIVVHAPKCASPTPRKWWEQSPLYKASIETFSEDAKPQGDLKGFSSKFDYLKGLGVKSVVISNILQNTNKAPNVGTEGDEFKTVASSYGTLDDMKNFIQKSKEKGLNLLLTVIPNHASLTGSLFNKSIHKEEPYTSFFVWASKKHGTSDDSPSPPNNWLSKINGSAWQWDSTRKEYYLHQFGKDEPEFNFRNPQVVDYFKNVMKYWLDLGVSGFYLERAPYLLEDSELRDDVFTQAGAAEPDSTHRDYGFYTHTHTMNLPELEPLLQDFTQFVSNHSGILLVDDVSVMSNKSVANLVIKTQHVRNPYPTDFNFKELISLINNTLKVNPWPVWQIEVENEEEDSDLARGVLLVTMLLPGVPVTRSGQEFGLKRSDNMPWNISENGEIDVKAEKERDPHSMLSVYHGLVQARESNSFLYGSVHLYDNSSVLAYTRLKSGSPSYLVMFNSGTEETPVNALKISPTIPDKLKVVVSTHSIPNQHDKKVDSTQIILQSRGFAVFQFVERKDE